jgi:hypothetical protein
MKPDAPVGSTCQYLSAPPRGKSRIGIKSPTYCHLKNLVAIKMKNTGYATIINRGIIEGKTPCIELFKACTGAPTGVR